MNALAVFGMKIDIILYKGYRKNTGIFIYSSPIKLD